MANNDLLQRFIFEHAPIRGEFIHLDNSLQDILNQHPYPPAVRQLLAEALCVAGLLSAIIKFEGRLTVQFRGKGGLKLLLAQCDDQFHIRGLAKWEGNLSYEDLMQSFHEGVLMIMLDSGPNQQRYQGVVAWHGNSLTESIENYFKHSEQLATRLWLAVDEQAAAGFLLQIVPGANQKNSEIEEILMQPHWQRIVEAMTVDPGEMLYLDYLTLLDKIYPEDEIRTFPAASITFQCTCSHKRGEMAISLLEREEAEAELKNHQRIVVTCDFCNKEYLFDRVDVAHIFEKKNKLPPHSQLH